ncbi:MAG TPA: DUF6094 domain-containing protein, partial [Chloroflexia bacterium]|nr:DUF6094 domain-containing protein [Chloroflexia bacterium]
MSNFGAVNVGWYFPTPLTVIPHVAALFDVQPAWRKVSDPDLKRQVYGSYAILDPSAGDGAALLAFAHALFGAQFPAYDKGPTLKLYGCELEEVRAGGLRAALQDAKLQSGCGEARHADAFQLTLKTSPRARGLSFLWANPPYDRDPDPVYGRLEQAFLTRFTPALTPGSGILIFLVPGHVLKNCAAYLAAEYDEIVAYRFPDGFYEDFKQVVVVARRRETPLPFGGGAAAVARLNAWAAAPATLPALPEPGAGRALFALQPGAQDGLADFAVNLVDMAQVLRHVIPWTAGTLDVTAPAPAYPLADGPRRGGRHALQALPDVGLDQTLDHFLCPVRPVLMPPRDAHRALFTAAGMFNNLTMVPDDPASGLPAIIIKGRFTKDFVDVKQNRDQEGHLTSTIAVQQPSMRVRMRTLTLPSVQVDLKAGTKPTGTTDPAQMTIADVLHHYGRGLATWMGRQFPPRHAPADADRLLPTPPLARALFQSQAHIVQACLKQLAAGENGVIQGEVGTGKTSVTLAILAALAAPCFAQTREALRRLGYWNARRPLRPVANVVVLVPPHLVSTWRDQARLVLPGADVVPVERLADLDAPQPSEIERKRALVSAARSRQQPTAGPRFLGDGVSPGAGLTLYVLNREKAKLGPGQRLAYHTHRPR